jgi:hypothetical protein
LRRWPFGSWLPSLDNIDGGVDSTIGDLERRQRATLRAVLLRATARAGNSQSSDPGCLPPEAPADLIPAAASMHRIEGTVLRGLDGCDGVAADVLDRLARLRHRALLHHLMVTAHLAGIRAAFDASGVAWVVMKGPVVASQLYPDPGDRTYADVDIMVARRDYPAAMAALEALGFEHSIHNWAHAEHVLAGQVEMKTQSLIVDLHWHLHYSASDRSPFALAPEEMIARRRAVSVSGQTVPTLDPVDTLLTLAFHAARSDGHRLVWLKDVERSLAVERPDVDELVRRCRSYRCGPPVGVVLNRARSLLGADVPDEVVLELTGRSLRLVDSLVSRAVHPVQFDERPTLTRWFTRSVRSSLVTTATAGPTRFARRLERRFLPPAANETDDPIEKERYLNAVVRSGG